MATRFELAGKHRLKLLNVLPMQDKVGQKDLKPAVHLRLRWRAPASALDMIDTALRPLLFKAGGDAAGAPPKKQAELEGVPSKTELSAAGTKLRTLHWEYEQTGCKFILYEAVTKIVLKDVTVKKQLAIHLLEGGSVDIEFSVYASDIDADTMGELGVRKQHEIEGELTLPEALQKELPGGRGVPLAPETPIGALSKGTKREPAGAPAH